MTFSRRFLLLGLALSLGGCASSKFQTYEGPDVTRIVVFKGENRMYLMHRDAVLRGYDIELGFAPVGHKQVEGDGKTPEGRYRIDRRNPNSSFHLSLGISYPNTADVARAAAMGMSPGGNIFIHGQPNLLGPQTEENWTAGCIAVTNAEMEEIYAMVETDTPIDIYP